MITCYNKKQKMKKSTFFLAVASSLHMFSNLNYIEHLMTGQLSYHMTFPLLNEWPYKAGWLSLPTFKDLWKGHAHNIKVKFGQEFRG